MTDQQHPWEIIPLEAYEAHMGHSDVRQWQTLNAIMREQMALYALPTVAIWGVASGNGVEHAISGGYKRIYGLDINRQYLKACAGRYPKEKDRLALLCMDLSSTNAKPPNAALIIANLFVEYVGIPCFVRQIKKAAPQAVSCVIQCSDGHPFVSASPHQDVFRAIALVHRDIDAQSLSIAMETAGFALTLSKTYVLPHNRHLLRLDYARTCGK